MTSPMMKRILLASVQPLLHLPYWLADCLGIAQLARSRRRRRNIIVLCVALVLLVVAQDDISLCVPDAQLFTSQIHEGLSQMCRWVVSLWNALGSVSDGQLEAPWTYKPQSWDMPTIQTSSTCGERSLELRMPTGMVVAVGIFGVCWSLLCLLLCDLLLVFNMNCTRVLPRFIPSAIMTVMLLGVIAETPRWLAIVTSPKGRQRVDALGQFALDVSNTLYILCMFVLHNTHRIVGDALRNLSIGKLLHSIQATLLQPLHGVVSRQLVRLLDLYPLNDVLRSFTHLRELTPALLDVMRSLFRLGSVLGLLVVRGLTGLVTMCDWVGLVDHCWQTSTPLLHWLAEWGVWVVVWMRCQVPLHVLTSLRELLLSVAVIGIVVATTGVIILAACALLRPTSIALEVRMSERLLGVVVAITSWECLGHQIGANVLRMSQWMPQPISLILTGKGDILGPEDQVEARVPMVVYLAILPGLVWGLAVVRGVHGIAGAVVEWWGEEICEEGEDVVEIDDEDIDNANTKGINDDRDMTRINGDEELTRINNDRDMTGINDDRDMTRINGDKELTGINDDRDMTGINDGVDSPTPIRSKVMSASPFGTLRESKVVPLRRISLPSERDLLPCNRKTVIARNGSAIPKPKVSSSNWESPKRKVVSRNPNMTG